MQYRSAATAVGVIIQMTGDRDGCSFDGPLQVDDWPSDCVLERYVDRHSWILELGADIHRSRPTEYCGAHIKRRQSSFS